MMLQKTLIFFSLLFAALLLTVNFPNEADSKLLAAAFKRSFECDNQPTDDEWNQVARYVAAGRAPRDLRKKLHSKQENEVIKMIIKHDYRLRQFISSVCIHAKISFLAYRLAEAPDTGTVQSGFIQSRLEMLKRNIHTIKQLADVNSGLSAGEDRYLTVHYHRKNADYDLWNLTSDFSSLPPESIDTSKLFGAKYTVKAKWENGRSLAAISLARKPESDLFGRTLRWEMTKPADEVWLIENVPEIFADEQSATNFIREHTVSAVNYLRVRKANGNYAGLGLHIWKLTRNTNEYRRIHGKDSLIKPVKYSKGVYFRLPIEKIGYSERVEFTLYREGKRELKSHLMWHLNQTDQIIADIDSNKLIVPSDKASFLAEIEK